VTPTRRAFLVDVVARAADHHGRTLTGPTSEALLQAADAIRELAAALEEVEGKSAPKPEAGAWRWVYCAEYHGYDLTTPDGTIPAFILAESDGYRPYIGNHRCTYADDLPAALAILRAKLGAGVPDLDLEACR